VTTSALPPVNPSVIAWALTDNSRPFVRLVFNALSQNRITATDAARYLDLRYEHIQKLTKRLHRSEMVA
jgi:hypothetical protein